MSFNFPKGAWLLLLLIPMLWSQWSWYRHRRRQQQAYAPAHLLRHLLTSRSRSLAATKVIGWIVIWTFICLALMEPFGNIRYTPSAKPSSIEGAIPQEVILLVDTSASMRVPDGPDGETRLEQAQEILKEIVNRLRGETVSLYAFTSELSPIVPPTVDYLFTRLSIEALQVDEGGMGGTQFAPVLKELHAQAFPHPSRKRYTLIMITDGGDTRLGSLTGEAREQEREAILSALPDPQAFHFHLVVLGVGGERPQPIPHVDFEGKPVSSKLESDILQALAAREKGRYERAQDGNAWSLAQGWAAGMREEEEIERGEAQTQRQVAAIKKEDLLVDRYYQIPLGVALFFYLLNFLLPDTQRP